MSALIIIAVSLALAAGLALLFARYKAQSDRLAVLEAKLGVAVVPFFRYVLTVLAPEITHPHQKYAVLDELVREALLEPETRMSDERLALMDKLLDERAVDQSDDMRPGEHAKALIVKQLVHLIRMEDESSVPLSMFTVVGQQQAEFQVSAGGQA